MTVNSGMNLGLHIFYKNSVMLLTVNAVVLGLFWWLQFKAPGWFICLNQGILQVALFTGTCGGVWRQICPTRHKGPPHHKTSQPPPLLMPKNILLRDSRCANWMLKFTATALSRTFEVFYFLYYNYTHNQRWFSPFVKRVSWGICYSET